MADVEVVIKIPDSVYNTAKRYSKDKHCIKIYEVDDILNAIANGTPLSRGHGRIVDIGKIDEDKIDSNNPIISLTIGGEYIEAVSLDYLNNLKTIIEADEEREED